MKALPAAKRQSVDQERKSKVYTMSLKAGTRKVDEQEMMMGL